MASWACRHRSPGAAPSPLVVTVASSSRLLCPSCAPARDPLDTSSSPAPARTRSAAYPALSRSSLGVPSSTSLNRPPAAHRVLGGNRSRPWPVARPRTRSIRTGPAAPYRLDTSAMVAAQRGPTDQVVARPGNNEGPTRTAEDDRVVPGPGADEVDLVTGDRHWVVSRPEIDLTVEEAAVASVPVEDLVVAGAGSDEVPPRSALRPHDDLVTAESHDDVVARRGADSVVTGGADEGG